MIIKARKKPVTVDAIEFTGWNWAECQQFMSDEPLFFTQEVRYQDEMYIDTLEGKMRADVGDYIIRGVSNEYYPCKPDIFHMTYDIVYKYKENVNDQKKIISEDNTIR